MKKLFFILSLVALIATSSAAMITGNVYTQPGKYSDIGEIITADGNVWGYDDGKSTDGNYIVVFTDCGTPGNIYDDMIIGLIAE